ncbi:aggrecan core protein-like isoform X2 [Glandiceps talaboti]
MTRAVVFCVLTIIVLTVKADNSWYSSSSEVEVEEPTENEHLYYNGVHYEFVHETKTWIDAKRHCRQDDGHLAQIKDSETNDAIVAFILSMSIPGRGYWIDARDKSKEGAWVYSNKLPLTFTAWGPDEPNSGGFNDNGIDEDCAMLLWYHNYQWNDQNCKDNFNFICQYAPQPEPAADVCTMERNIDRKGSDLNNGLYNVVENPEACCQSCHESSDCLSWTFDKRSDSYGQCWLKTEVPPQTYSFCCDSGYIEGRLGDHKDWTQDFP